MNWWTKHPTFGYKLIPFRSRQNFFNGTFFYGWWIFNLKDEPCLFTELFVFFPNMVWNKLVSTFKSTITIKFVLQQMDYRSRNTRRLSPTSPSTTTEDVPKPLAVEWIQFVKPIFSFDFWLYNTDYMDENKEKFNILVLETYYSITGNMSVESMGSVATT